MATARKPKAVKFPTRIQPEEHFATKADVADVKTQVAKLETRMESRIARLETKMETKIANLETKMETKMANLETKMERQKTELIKWMVAIMGIFSSIIIAAIKL